MSFSLEAGAQTVQQKVSAEQGSAKPRRWSWSATIHRSSRRREVALKQEAGADRRRRSEGQRLADLKVGDLVEIQYIESLTLSLSKAPGGVASKSEASTEMRNEPTELPGGIKAKQTTITAKVTAVDVAASTVTLVGPKGRSVELAVEPEVAKSVKVGDMVSAIYTEAVAVSVSRPDAH
jgi:hypothetical protein